MGAGIPPLAEIIAVDRKIIHALVAIIRHMDNPVRVHGNAAREGSALARPNARGSYLDQKGPIVAVLVNAVIVVVRSINISPLVAGDTVGAARGRVPGAAGGPTVEV